MPIPPFDGILNVIPPHLGDPKRREDLSPYSCTVEELCDRFATSPKRREILDGFLALRREFFKIGLKGFQWVDGSFVEDIEMHEGRDPDDIDVVTFVDSAKDDLALLTLIQSSNKLLLSPRHIKTTYLVHHFLISLGSKPELLVDTTRYFCGLFSHRKSDDLWKGMLSVKLDGQADDIAAREILGGKP